MNKHIVFAFVAFFVSTSAFAGNAASCAKDGETNFQLCMGHGVKGFLLPVSNAVTRSIDWAVTRHDVWGDACKEKRKKEIERCQRKNQSAD